MSKVHGQIRFTPRRFASAAFFWFPDQRRLAPACPGNEGFRYGATAIADISTFASSGNRATWTVARAGGAVLKYVP